jgi:hypothetical protein
MNIENLTIGEARQLAAMFSINRAAPLPDPLLGSYVIVRCRDAGVHAGVLESRAGRECVLTESRRLWYWKPARGKWLSAVANHGLHEDSKISEPVARIALTEDCELIQCSVNAERSIREAKTNE